MEISKYLTLDSQNILHSIFGFLNAHYKSTAYDVARKVQ